MTLEDEARQLIINGEEAAREARNTLKQKAVLQPQYELYLKVLTRSQRPKAARADDYLRVVRAMRDEQEFATLKLATDEEDSSIKGIVSSPLRVLGAYLERLPGTVVLMIERGFGVLTMFTLRGGSEPLEERIILERASKACVDSLVALMQQQDEDIERIRRLEPITNEFFERIERAAVALWTALPEAICSAISRARNVLYLPSSYGDLSAFPLELLYAEDGWLGTTRSVTRLSSIRTLLELLSPGRIPSKLDAHALVVRAQDSEELTKADVEADAVCQGLESLGLVAKVDRQPRVASVREALDRGMRVLHYCGHGFAGNLGEFLPLTAKETLGPHDFSQLSGWRTPFVYLSTCEVGRARMRTTGSAEGFSTRLIEKGAPAVVGCLDSVPDLVAGAMAESFYRSAATLPLGEALATARGACRKYPPACWGAFAYFGDPLLKLTAADGVVPQTRRKTLRWDSLVGRHLAVRSDDSRQQALDALAVARTEGGADADLLNKVAGWLESSFRSAPPELKEERLELCLAVAEKDAIAGCELRMLLAMESLQRSYFGKRKPRIVLLPEEVMLGLYCAKAVHDSLAWAAFAIENAHGGGIGYEPLRLLQMLEEAVGVLDGWRLEVPAAETLLSTARELKRDLQESHGNV